MLASHILGTKDTKTHILRRLSTYQMRHICVDFSGSKRKLAAVAEPTITLQTCLCIIRRLTATVSWYECCA